MKVDSYLEIFTTMYGWAFANIISSAIVGTGLVVVPFFVIIFKKWMEVKEQGMQAGGIMSLLESAQTRLIAALFVATLCFFHAPGVSLKSVDLSYQAPVTLLESNPQEVSKDKGTNSGYDSGMQDAKSLNFGNSGNSDLDRVPLWWFSVMAISSGINSAIRDALGSFENHTREVQHIAQMATLENKDLADKARAFAKECFAPASAAFDEKNLSATAKAIYDKDKGDIAWSGSEVFLADYYDKPPKNPNAFKLEPTSTACAGAGNQTLCSPTCKEIWLGYGTQKGLLYEIADHSRTSRNFVETLTQSGTKGLAGIGARLQAWWQGKDTKQAAASVVAQVVLSQTEGVQAVDNAQFAPTEYDRGSIRNTAAAVGSGLGVAWNGFKAQMMRQPLLTGLPMAQALLLMGIYTFLPLAVFLSGYDLRALFIGTLALFTVKMFASMWVIAQWMDAKLVASMYSSTSNTVSNALSIVPIMSILQPQRAIDSYKLAILDTLLVWMLIGLPILWISMMGWLGIHLNTAIGSVMGAAHMNAQKSAETSASAISTGARMAATRRPGK